MFLTSDAPGWFALQVRVHREQQVATMLRWKGYEEFLPTARPLRRDSAVHVPLFPGYIFCRLRPESQGLIVTTPGAIRIVSFGGKPAEIDAEEIRSIRLVVESGAPAYSVQGLEVGNVVRVEEGPLRGVTGILTSIRKQTRLLISITMMMRTLVAEVCPEWVKRVTPVPHYSNVRALPAAAGM